MESRYDESIVKKFRIVEPKLPKIVQLSSSTPFPVLPCTIIAIGLHLYNLILLTCFAFIFSTGVNRVTPVTIIVFYIVITS